MIAASIGEAFHKTRALLFKPFSWNRWAKLVLIAWLAGSLSGGTSFNWMNSRKVESAKNPSASSSANHQTPAGSSAGLNPSLVKKVQELHAKKYWFEHGLFKGAADASGKIPGWYMAAVVWPLVIFFVLLFLALIIFFIWLSSRFKFVWLHAVQTEELSVRRVIRQYENQADSLTSFYILASFLTLVYFTAILVPMVLQFLTAMRAGGNIVIQDIGFLWKFFWPLGTLFLFSVLVTLVFYTLVGDFVVPLMASEDLLFKEAFRRWLSMYRKSRPAVWRYFLTKLFALIVAGAFTMALTIMVLIMTALVAVLIFGPLYLMLFVWVKMKIFFWVCAVVLGTPLFVLAMLAVMTCALPAAVFFRAFSLYFLSRLAPECRFFTGQGANF